MKRLINLSCAVILLAGLVIPSQRVNALGDNQKPLKDNVQALFERMTVEERVGQVFLVTFQGMNIKQDSPIFDLIQRKHIGGVVLRRDNDNFTGPENTLTSIRELIAYLQTLEWEYSQPETSLPGANEYIPLFIGTSQEGDVYPNDQLLNGMTALPSQMAIGATWKTENAQTVGRILGGELETIGVNMLFGPSLDVLDAIRADNTENLGVRTFGGDPYWVGEMGKAYVKGIHEGSTNRVAVIAKHFPGQGESDRKPEEEIATVRKSLEQLKQIELAPFFAVTGNTIEESEQVDGLLLSHIRYQGFQGNIRATTKPISFDSTALSLILTLPQFINWHSSGGLIVSDDLGSEAVRKFYDPLKNSFDAKQIARNALLAGNDVLYMGNIISTNDTDSYVTLVKTIDFFVQKYKEDTAFQARLDQAVLKILEKKMEIYPRFIIEDVIPVADERGYIANTQNDLITIAQESVTLISPDPEEISSVLPSPPEFNDQIVFISEVINFRQCSICVDQTINPAESLRNSVTRMYGTGFGDLVQSNRMISYTFEHLRLLLEGGTGIDYVHQDLAAADWIVFAFTNLSQSAENKVVLERFLSERPELTRNKKIIGMAFNAPYFLDATDISKFTAYYGLYSKTPEYFDVAARVLFQELTPTGKLPVSVTGVGYDLIEATSPNPDQMIPLVIVPPGDTGRIENTPPAEYSQPLSYKAGDSIPIRAGIILDKNGNKVPDGTLVKFIIDMRNSNGGLEQIEMQTINGIAKINYVLPGTSTLEIRVTADPAMISQILRLDITETGGILTSIEPTEPMVIVVEVTPTPAPTEIPIPLTTKKHMEGRLNLIDWLLTTVLIFSVCFLFNWSTRKKISMKWNVLLTLSIGFGGYIAYILLAFGFLQSEQQVSAKGTPFILFMVILGLLVGWGVATLYYLWKSRKKTSAKDRDQETHKA